jgi:hypothetical protein
MTRRPVLSSNLASMGYDPARRDLVVEFRTGAVYRYHDVDPATWRRLEAEAEAVEAGNVDASVGRLFVRTVKVRAAWTRVSGATAIAGWLLKVERHLNGFVGGRFNWWGDMRPHLPQLERWHADGVAPEAAARVLFDTWTAAA